MPKISEFDIETIKNSVDLVSLCRSRGISLKRSAKTIKAAARSMMIKTPPSR